MQSTEALINQARGETPGAQAAIDAVAARRRQLAAALLASESGEQALMQRLAEVERFAQSYLPWEPGAEDYNLMQRILSAWTAAAAPPPRAVMAAMALAPAHHFPTPVPLATVPGWLRLAYARYLFSAPLVFLHGGEADRLAAHLTEAMARLHQAILVEHSPDARALAMVVAQSMSLMGYFNEQNLRSYYRHRAEILEWLLDTLGLALDHLPSLAKHSRPRVGIFHRGIFPGTESYYLLAHLEGRPKESMEVILYVLHDTSGPLTAAFAPWVDRIVKLPNGTPNAVARIRDDDLDVMLVASNITSEVTPVLEIAAHRLARVQVVGGASPVSPAFGSGDLYLSGELNDPSPGAQAHYEETLVRLPGTVSYYAFKHDNEPQTVSCAREEFGFGADQVVFFSAANYFKIGPEVLKAWAEILARLPSSRLLLMPYNPNWMSSYPAGIFQRRLVHELLRSGISPDRAIVISKVPTRADLRAVMALADIYLDSFPFSGACSLLDPLQVGLPVVAREGKTFRSAVAGSLLRPAGLGDMLCADGEAYVGRAVALAREPELRRRERERIRQAMSPEPYCVRTVPYARKFTDFCVTTAASWASRSEALRDTDPGRLRVLVRDLAGRLAEAANPRFRRLTDLRIIAQLLVPYVRTLTAESRASGRIIDVGACLGEASLPFLQAGLVAEMFEPDPDCAARLAELGKQFPDRARHHAMAVVGEAAAAVTFHKRALGLSGLGGSPFAGDARDITLAATTLGAFCGTDPRGVDLIKIDAEGHDLEILKGIAFAQCAPRLVMVEFGTQFPLQSFDQIEAALARMAEAGYGAVVFANRMLEGFGKTGWACELVHLAFDAVTRHQATDSFGNMVFFRPDDATFLGCLLLLLESYLPARQRSSLSNRPADLNRLMREKIPA